MKIVSSFIHPQPQVVSDLYEFRSSAEHKRRYFEESQHGNQSIGNQNYLMGPINLHMKK